MKLTQDEKQDYKELKRALREQGGKFVEGYQCGQAVTAAVLVEGDYFQVAIAVQGRDDEYNRKRGKYEALCKLYTGQYLAVPRRGVFQFGTITQELLWTPPQKRNLHN